jgi:hypothetical protein
MQHREHVKTFPSTWQQTRNELGLKKKILKRHLLETANEFVM